MILHALAQIMLDELRWYLSKTRPSHCRTAKGVGLLNIWNAWDVGQHRRPLN